MFYPDKKPHISPSALANWHEARGMFVRSYFIGEKTPETASMKAGKKIHALVEGRMLEVVHNFEEHEKTLTFELPIEAAGTRVLGIPDSYERKPELDVAYFVDYKSGKENNWDDGKLSADLKMKTTAWLVWNETGKPSKVVGYIEYIPTQWNPISKAVEPTGGESTVAGECVYTAEEMAAFTDVILKTIKEVNEGYEEWLTSTDEFVSQEDVAEYAQLAQECATREARMEVILERIGDQMKMGGKESIPSPFGSFYFTSKKKYEPIPPESKINYLDRGITWDDAEQIAAAASAFKKKFETEHDPIEVKKSLAFRAKKK